MSVVNASIMISLLLPSTSICSIVAVIENVLSYAFSHGAYVKA